VSGATSLFRDAEHPSIYLSFNVRGNAMYRMICSAAALLALCAVGGAEVSDDADVCENGEGDIAIAACTRVLDRDPKDADAYKKRLLLYLEKDELNLTMDHYDRAIADLKQVITLDPKDEFALFLRGYVYARKGEYDRAIADYDQVIARNPKDAGYYSARGITYYLKKEYDRAIADYDKAIALNPTDAGYYSTRGTTYYLKKEYDRAIADYDKAIAIEPAAALTYSVRGDSYADKGEYDRAIADYDLALKLDPGLTPARENRERVQAALAARTQPAK
jgi:tetratricopeptide (TPR) repeat protein